ELQLLNPEGHIITSATDRTSVEGRFQAVLRLPIDAAEGMYQINATHEYSTALTSFMCRKRKGTTSSERP
ncbi:MAG: hypothetical protein ACE5PO_07880, partial [Candidatus Bathyarchaeia archaeon]